MITDHLCNHHTFCYIAPMHCYNMGVVPVLYNLKITLRDKPKHLQSYISPFLVGIHTQPQCTYILKELKVLLNMCKAYCDIISY